MAITSGVRAPRAQIMIGGQSFNVLSASVNQEATRRSRAPLERQNLEFIKSYDRMLVTSEVRRQFELVLLQLRFRR
jgi:hypothetical protein